MLETSLNADVDLASIGEIREKQKNTFVLSK